MFLKRLTLDIFVLFVLITMMASIVFLSVATRTYRSYTISSKEEIMNRRNTGLVLLDRHERIFFAFERARPGTFIPLNEIPLHVRKAIIISEDRTFFSHYGFAPQGIIRSIYLNWEKQSLTYGGSTLTQQLAKNSFLTPDKSFRRKFNELILAIKFERHFSKDDILEMYLNSAYFGEGVFGIEAAANTYFDKSAQELSLAEASILAAILPEPANLSPVSGNSFERTKQRQRTILQRMMEEEYISPEEKITAENAELAFNTKRSEVNTYAPHFALMVRDELFRKFGEEYVIRSGFKVKTTIDLDWQKYVEDNLKNHVNSLASYRATNGAAVILEPKTGEIKALVGSPNWHHPTFGMINMATRPRQTGSTFKPVVYAAALQARIITPSTVLQDTPRTFGLNYRPRNYDGRFRGNILARSALANSVNVPAVDIMHRTGSQAVLSTAQNLGISTMDEQSSRYLPTALGSESISLLEMTGAYATFANYGKKQPTRTVLEISDKYDDIVEYEYEVPRQVIPAGVAFQISSMLSDKQARTATFGNMLDLPFSAAVKTGTTQHFRDAWTIGYTPNIAVGIWIGNSNNAPMGNLPGARGSAPLWRNFMLKFTDETSTNEFIPPTDVLAVRVCHHNGLPIRGEGHAGYTEYFLVGTQPTGSCVIATPTPEPPAQEEENTEKKEEQKQEPEKQIAGAQNSQKEKPLKKEEATEKPPAEKKETAPPNHEDPQPPPEEKPEPPPKDNPDIPIEEQPVHEVSENEEEKNRRELWRERREG